MIKCGVTMNKDDTDNMVFVYFNENNISTAKFNDDFNDDFERRVNNE